MKIRILIYLLLLAGASAAHPTGDMVVLGDRLYWSYISPVNDRDHHACIMTWKEGEEPSVLLKSTFPASDFMLSVSGNILYILERRYDHSREQHFLRVLKMKTGNKPTEIWPWFEDSWRVGEAGFVMADDETITFCKYPAVYQLDKQIEVKKLDCFTMDVHRIRKAAGGLLIMGESAIWLADLNGQIVNKWSNLLLPEVPDAPLNRNQIFDACYQQGSLLIAYWGRRTFEIFESYGKKKIIQLKSPLAPHWVAGKGRAWYLFASTITFDGETPQPKLQKLKNESITTIWAL